MKSLAPRRHPVALVLLMAVLVLAFAFEGSQPAHTHEDGRPGLYNAECPLAKIAAMHADGWSPPTPALGPPVDPARIIVVTPHVWAPSPSTRFTDSRAPPLA